MIMVISILILMILMIIAGHDDKNGDDDAHTDDGEKYDDDAGGDNGEDEGDDEMEVPSNIFGQFWIVIKLSVGPIVSMFFYMMVQLVNTYYVGH